MIPTRHGLGRADVWAVWTRRKRGDWPADPLNEMPEDRTFLRVGHGPGLDPRRRAHSVTERVRAQRTRAVHAIQATIQTTVQAIHLPSVTPRSRRRDGVR